MLVLSGICYHNSAVPNISLSRKTLFSHIPDFCHFVSVISFITLALHAVLPASAADKTNNPFPPNSPEHAALSAASEFLANDAFLLRQDYWQGNLTTETGKALQLQFFKGNRYRFFFAVSKEHLPDKALLHLHIYDKASNEVASVSSQGSANVIDLQFNPKSTGLYLVLMSIEVPKNSSARTGIPSVMFYGYE